MGNLNQKQICLLMASSLFSSLSIAANSSDEVIIPIQNEESRSRVERVIESINSPYPTNPPSVQPQKGYTDLDPVTIEDKTIKIIDYEELCGKYSDTGAIVSAVLQGSLIVAGFLSGDGRDQSQLPQITDMEKPKSDRVLT